MIDVYHLDIHVHIDSPLVYYRFLIKVGIRADLYKTITGEDYKKEDIVSIGNENYIPMYDEFYCYTFRSFANLKRLVPSSFCALMKNTKEVNLGVRNPRLSKNAPQVFLSKFEISLGDLCNLVALNSMKIHKLTMANPFLYKLSQKATILLNNDYKDIQK